MIRTTKYAQRLLYHIFQISVCKRNLIYANYTIITLVVVHVNVQQRFPFGFLGGGCALPRFKYTVGCISVSGDGVQSVADVALQCFLDELEAAFVQKRVLFLWLADVEVIYVYLNELPDAKIC